MRKQIVRTEPLKLLVGSYLTNKGKKLLELATTNKKKNDIKQKYTKNKYTINRNSKQLKTINHLN